MVPCFEVLVSREGISEEKVHMVLLDLVDLLFHLAGVVQDLEGQDLISGEALVEFLVEVQVLNVLSVVGFILVNAGESIQ